MAPIRFPGDHRQGPTTPRLQLRALTPADAEAAFRLNSDPEVMRYTGEALWPDVATAERFLRAYPDFDTVGVGRWGVCLRASGEVVGFSGLKYLPELDAVDLGYRLMRHHWGRGLATEAGRASLAYAFDVLGLDQVVGQVMPANTASVRVLQKLGMRRVGAVTCQGTAADLYRVSAADFAALSAAG